MGKVREGMGKVREGGKEEEKGLFYIVIYKYLAMSIKSTWIFKYTRHLNAYFKALQASNVGVVMLFVCAIILFFFVKWVCMSACMSACMGGIRPINKQKTVSWRDEQGDGRGLEMGATPVGVGETPRPPIMGRMRRRAGRERGKEGEWIGEIGE